MTEKLKIGVKQISALMYEIHHDSESLIANLESSNPSPTNVAKHIELNTLLPHCRFQTPTYLTDTIIRLLNGYEDGGKVLPRFDSALLVIDEHCNINSRVVYDQDNKGWKAIPNSIKGRLVRDDDQFTLEVALLSTLSDKPACHIHILPQEAAGDFFLLRNDARF